MTPIRTSTGISTEGYTWGLEGRRSWRVGATPGPSERLNWCRASDFTDGRCPIRQDGPCDAMAACHFLERVLRRRSGVPGRARRIAAKLEIHRTPEHGSRPNMAEIELSVLARHCPDRRLETRADLERFVAL